MPRGLAIIDYMQGSDSTPYSGGTLVGATINGNGTVADVSGAASTLVEVQELGGGTATLALEGSFDGSTWYAVGYEQVDATAAPARAVASISVTASMKHTYAVLDNYPQLRAVLSAVAGGAAVVARAYSAGR